MAFHKHDTVNKTYEKFVEKSESILEAEVELIPNVDYSRDEAYKLAGLGVMFNGTYRFRKLSYNITSSGLSIRATARMVYDTSGNFVEDGYQKGEVFKEAKKPTVATKVKADKNYTVKSGDTLSAIAQKMTGNASDSDAIAKANSSLLISKNKKNADGKGNYIYPGQVLKIPGILLK